LHENLAPLAELLWAFMKHSNKEFAEWERAPDIMFLPLPADTTLRKTLW